MIDLNPPPSQIRTNDNFSMDANGYLPKFTYEEATLGERKVHFCKCKNPKYNWAKICKECFKKQELQKHGSVKYVHATKPTL